MNWFKQNSFLSGLLIVVVIGVVGLGFLVFRAWGGYGEAVLAYESALSSKQLKEREVPYPSRENADAWEAEVKQYKEDSTALRMRTRTLQIEMPAEVQANQFQNSLTEKVQAVIEAAGMQGVVLDEGFFLGMDSYRSSPPSEVAATRLQFQLEGIHELMKTLMENGATAIKILRPVLPFETPGVTNEPPRGARAPEFDPVENYPFEISIVSTGPAAQQILNVLSNTKGVLKTEGVPESGNFYYIPRFLRIENEQEMGPEKVDPNQVAAAAELAAANPSETAVPTNTLNMVFGTEKIKTYIAVDLVRFLSPPAEEAAN